MNELTVLGFKHMDLSFRGNYPIAVQAWETLGSWLQPTSFRSSHTSSFCKLLYTVLVYRWINPINVDGEAADQVDGLFSRDPVEFFTREGVVDSIYPRGHLKIPSPPEIWYHPFWSDNLLERGTSCDPCQNLHKLFAPQDGLSMIDILSLVDGLDLCFWPFSSSRSSPFSMTV